MHKWRMVTIEMTALFSVNRKFLEAFKLFSVYFKAIVTEDRKNCPVMGMHSTILRVFHKLQTLRFANFFTRFPSLRILSSLYFRLLFLSLLPIGNDNTTTPFSRIFLSRIWAELVARCFQVKSCENLSHPKY